MRFFFGVNHTMDNSNTLMMSFIASMSSIGVTYRGVRRFLSSAIHNANWPT